MPIRLEPPEHDPLGPDGRGRNRLQTYGGMMCLPECALRPKTEGAFWEAQNTMRATYGHYGACTESGKCEECKRFNARVEWPAFTPEFVVRVDERGMPWMMNRQEDGWSSTGYWRSWEYIYQIPGKIERGRDKHGSFIKFYKPAQGGKDVTI